MSHGLSRHPIYYKIVGYTLYGLGGFALVVNTRCTAIAYRDSDIPLMLGWGFAALFSVVAIGVGLFLSSPSAWGELWFGFLGTARNAGRHGDRSAPRVVTAILLALVVTALGGFLAVVYALDLVTTWDYFARLGVKGFYLLSAVLVLLFGPETSFILAHAILLQGKRASVPYLLEATQIEPQLEYLKQVRAGRVATARQAGQKDANQYQH